MEKDLLTRGVEKIYPTSEALKKVLSSGKKLRIYHGMDATGKQLHLGHLSNLMILEKFRCLGHKVFVLFGDFTATIGDPTDKMAARIKLSEEQVRENLKTWKDQISRIVNFNDKNNPAKIVKNSEWLSKLDFREVTEIASHLTAQNILERDMFQERMKNNKVVYLHELLYPLMQGYDSVHLDADIEIGGSDQTFNMLVGRELQKKLNNKEKFVITTTLLVNPNTKKKLMSKSEGYLVGLDESPKELFGGIMSMPDEAIIQLFTDCTNVPMLEIEKIKNAMSRKLNPRDAKARLAKEIISLLYDSKEAEKAEKEFENIFQKKELPEDIKEIKISGNFPLPQFLVDTGLTVSTSEARRLISAGAVEIDNTKITDYKATISTHSGMIIKVGKRRFAKII